jgi:hypothetical protein
MKVINTRVHGILDYLVSLILIACPWVLGFSRGGAETWVPVALGAAAIVYSLMTRYELGVARMLTMRTHLGLDIASGIVLALSPWIFHFSDLVYMPHLIFGILEIGVALMTDPSTYRQHEGNIAGQM